MTEPSSVSPQANEVLADEVARVSSDGFAPLDRVGMRGIEMPVRVTTQLGEFLIPAVVSAFVDLNNCNARGIHMSRLYRLCDEHLGRAVLSAQGLSALLDDMLLSHEGLSDIAEVTIAFVVPIRRSSLLSGLSGWRQYPVRINASRQQGRWRCVLGVDVLYSSTCPGSAAMSRQVIRDNFVKTFGEGHVDATRVAEWLESPAGVAATPHAQRSRAQIDVALPINHQGALPIELLLDAAEAALGTAVQAAVKRIDEQEFARLNGTNPLYCEDAIRRLRNALEALPWAVDYMIDVEHLESLHAHDAVAKVVKGVPDGFRV